VFTLQQNNAKVQQCHNATQVLDSQIMNSAAMRHVLNWNPSLIVKLQALQSVQLLLVLA